MAEECQPRAGIQEAKPKGKAKQWQSSWAKVQARRTGGRSKRPRDWHPDGVRSLCKLPGACVSRWGPTLFSSVVTTVDIKRSGQHLVNIYFCQSPW